MRTLRVFRWLFLAALVVSPSGRAAVNLIDSNDWKVFMSGFVEFDMIVDTTKSLAETAGNTAIARPGTNAGDFGRTQFSIRNSRLAFGLLPPEYEGWKTKGYFEFDLLGFDPTPGSPATNTESSFFTNPSFRVRHAYISAESSGWQILAGQTWTLFGWQPVYIQTTVSLPPVAGVLYERSPQLTVIKSSDLSDKDVLQAGFSVVRPVQRDSMIPNLDAGVRTAFGERTGYFATPSGDVTAQPLSFALSGTLRDVSTPAVNPGGNSTHYVGGALAFDTLIPIISADEGNDDGEEGDPDHERESTLLLLGEFTIGKGYGDQFPSWTGGLGQMLTSHSNPNYPNLDPGIGGFNSAGGFDLVRLKSFNLSLQYHLPQEWHSFITLGYAQLTSNNSGVLVPATGVAYDLAQVAWVNIFHDFTDHIRAAFETDYFQTHYVDGVSAHNWRFQLSGWFRF